MKPYPFLPILTLLLAPLSLAAQPATSSEEHAFKAATWIEGLENPWGLVKLPDGRFLVTERPGRLRLIEDEKLLEAPVSGVPEVVARGQGGLLDIELHPNYAENGWIYLAFSKPMEKGSLTSIVRGKLQDGAFKQVQTVFDPPAEDATGAGIHYGCRMEFDTAGFLYFSIGDRGDKMTPENNAQQVTNVKGKIHRLHDDGRVPVDNPFVNTPGASPSIWCYGNRNAQGLRFQPGTDLLWETEHGPQGGDELNTIRKGANYGWPVISYGVHYGKDKKPFTDKTEMEGMEQPVIHWTPSIAVCGIDFYNSDVFPKWKGNLFVSALAHNRVVRVVIEDGKVTHQEQLLKGQGRVRDVRCFDDGFVYAIYDHPGKIVRLTPAD